MKELNLTFSYLEDKKKSTCYINISDGSQKINCSLTKYEFKSMKQSITTLYNEAKSAFYSLQRELLNTVPFS